MRISRCQQSMKGILWKIDCQLVANEGEGGRVTRLLQSLLGVISLHYRDKAKILCHPFHVDVYITSQDKI